MNIRNALISLFVCLGTICTSPLVFAQQQVNFQVYKVTVTDNKGVIHYQERWTDNKIDAAGYLYSVRKVTPTEKGIRVSLEAESAWSKLVISNEGEYVRYRYDINPAYGQKSGYGHVEIWTSGFGKIIAMWPLFYKTVQVNTHLVTTITMYLPDNTEHTLVREYIEEQYGLPRSQTYSVKKPGGDGTLVTISTVKHERVAE